MYCMNCGRQLPDGATFCRYCGNPVKPAVRTAARKGGTATPLLELIIRVIGGLLTVYCVFWIYDDLTNFTGGFFGASGIISAIFGGAFAALGMTLLIGGTKLPRKLLDEINNAARSRRF